MDFDLTEEQALLKDAVTRLLRERYPFETRRRAANEPGGWSKALWSDFATQGLLAIGFPESAGGYGGAVEAMIVAEAMGAALCAEPYLSSVAMASTTLPDQISAEIISGKATVACALEGFIARKDGDAWIFNGSSPLVAHGDSADYIIIAANDALVCVRSNAIGLTRRAHRTLDGWRAAEVTAKTLRVAKGDVLATGSEAEIRTELMQAHATAFLAAEASGLMSMLLDVTVEHLKTRVQFGQPLSKNQALQHRAVDMLGALEQVRSIAIYAAAALDDPDVEERRKAMAAAKAVVANAARLVGQQAVQLHGGIGLTEEHRVGWGLKRLTMIELMFGDAETQAARLASLGGFVAPV